MKKIIILLAISNLGITQINAQSEWSNWAGVSCYKGFSFRVKNIGFNKYVNKYEWIAQVKNNYNRRVNFDMSWKVGNDEQSIGRFTLDPGGVTNAVSYYFTSDENSLSVFGNKVCFGDNFLSCGDSGTCYAECDEGSPNIPADCGGNANTTNKNLNTNTNTSQTKNTNTYQTNTNSTNQSSSNSNTGIYTPPTTQTNKSVGLTLLQNKEFIDASANVLDDIFASIKKRKEEKRRQRELKEEAKQAQADREKEKMSYHTLFETKSFDTYCQYTVNELLQKAGMAFTALEYYGIFDNSKSTTIRFDKLKLMLMYNYYTSSDLTATITLEFKNKDWVEEFLKSDAFAVFKNNSITNTVENKKITFSSVKFDSDPNYKTVASELQNSSYTINVYMLLDSITRKAEGPIDTTKKLGEALREKGDIYSQGKGIMWDKQIAYEYYKKAWELGDVKSAVSLGYLFLFDPLKDYVKARAYFDSAAAKGEISAMSGIGLMYQYGYGVPKDLTIAKGLYEKGVALGDWGSTAFLYYMYKYDETEKNPVLAKQWLEKACKQSLAETKFYCDLLEQEEQ